MTSLISFLSDNVERSPHKTGLFAAGGEHASFTELAVSTENVARALVVHGISPGDRVVVCLENSAAHVVALFAVWRAGAVAVLVNPATRPEKLAWIVANAQARAAIVEAKRAAGGISTAGLEVVMVVGKRNGELHELEAIAHRPLIDFTVARGGDDGSDVDDDDIDDILRDIARGVADDTLAALIYTSGSTGTPKGVMHTHGSLVAASRSIAEYLNCSATDVVLQVLPLSFGYGLTQLLTTMLVGGTLVLERGFAFPQVVLRRIAEMRATGIAVVPTIASLLLDAGLRAHGDYDFSSLRYITNAGAGMAPALSRRMREALPDVELFLMYGQTECIRGSYLPPREVDRRPTSVGTGIPHSELRLVDDDGRPAAERGELVIRGRHVMLGYWNQPETTAQKVRATATAGERELYTGDLFRRDEDGFLHFIARKDDVIKTRGEKVSPKEVEDVLVAIPGIAAAAVIGVDDELLGQAVKAFVVASAPNGNESAAPFDARALRRACAERLEEWAIPKHIALLDELPRNENGKVDKRALREADGRSAQGATAAATRSVRTTATTKEGLAS